MGASDSKLVFKQGIFKLSEQKDIPADDNYWTNFWELPESVDDIFSLFSPADIRRIRDESLGNFETLILAVSSRLFALRNHPSFPHSELAPANDALNCIRILTRLLPFIFESEKFERWEEQFFWTPRRRRIRQQSGRDEVVFDGENGSRTPLEDEPQFEDVKPLAEELLNTLVDCLFFTDFTLPRVSGKHEQVHLSIWQSGVGCNSAIGTSRELENNRMEVLRLLLTICSKSMYTPAKSDEGIPPKNNFRHFLGKLHRPQDFQFLVDGMTRVLNQPAIKLQANSSYLPGSQKELFWAPEMIMLFWEVLQCNKRFRSFIVDTDRAHDFVVLVLFYALQHRNDVAQQGIVRMCVFVLQTLSVEPTFGARLNKPFRGQDSLPTSIRIPNFRGSYADFLLISIHVLITGSAGKLDAIYPALLAVINNIAPHAEDLSPTASLKLMQLFAIMSSPDFLFANETNHELLKSLLEALNAVIEYQYEKNASFVFAILRSQKRFYAVREFVQNGATDELDRYARKRKERLNDPATLSSPTRGLGDNMRSPITARKPTLSDVPENEDAFAIGEDSESETEGQDLAEVPSRSSVHSDTPSRAASIASSVDDAVPTQLRGMSEKARGKLPAGHNSFSRNGSSTSLSSLAMTPSAPNGNFEPTEAWVESWLAELPLHTIITLIEQLTPLLPPQGSSSTSGPALAVIRQTQLQGLDAAPMRVHLFEWSPLSLGWYESLLWGFVFSSEVAMFKGAAGIWKGTQIKLFRVQEAAMQGPSLLAPRGAVDAVGSTLVQGFGRLNLRSNQAQRNGNGGGMVRDV
ncbi:MAG: hypothetical protein Q9159_002643 [Coniocarpon cinnabarinum]